MLEQFPRPLDAAEISRLRDWLNRPAPARSVWNLGCTGALLVYVLCFMTAFVFGAYLEAAQGLRGGWGWSFLVAWGIGLLLIRVLNYIRRRRGLQHWEALREELRQDLADGRADVIRCTVDDAVRVNFSEDFGWGWFLDIGHGKILYLDGLYLDDLFFDEYESLNRNSAPDWPAEFERPGEYPDLREIKVVRTARSRRIVDLRRLGERFEPSADILPEDSPELDLASLDLPQNGFVFSGSLKTLADDVDRALANVRATRDGPA